MELPISILGIPTDSQSSLLTGLALQPLQREPQAPQALQALQALQVLQALQALRWAEPQPPHHVQLQSDRPCRALHPGPCHPGGLFWVCLMIQRNIHLALHMLLVFCKKKETRCKQGKGNTSAPMGTRKNGDLEKMDSQSTASRRYHFAATMLARSEQKNLPSRSHTLTRIHGPPEQNMKKCNSIA